jgi:hypothetical protein
MASRYPCLIIRTLSLTTGPTRTKPNRHPQQMANQQVRKDGEGPGRAGLEGEADPLPCSATGAAGAVPTVSDIDDAGVRARGVQETGDVGMVAGHHVSVQPGCRVRHDGIDHIP